MATKKKTSPAEEERASDVADKALEAFWEVVGEAYPESEYGALSPKREEQLLHAAEAAVAEWAENIIPPDDKELITEEDRANARLVAAAPELLERCKMALADAEAAIANPSEVVDYNWPSIAEDLRAVIAKADGIPPETDHANA